MYKIMNIPLPEEKIISLDEFYNSMQSQKYRKHYERLITRSKDRALDCYIEKHHVIPKCLGGLNEDENYAYLTAEEHYTAHLLLCKIFPKNKKITLATKMMTIDSWGVRSNKLYGWVRRKFSENQSGENHHLYNKNHSAETRLKMSITRKDRIVPEETKIKMSKAQMNRPPISEETRAKMSAWQKDKKLSSEHKAKIAESAKGNKHRLGTKQTKETCLKISESLKGNSRALGSKRCKLEGGK
ncbi:MAG: hypothetical protein A2W11_06140 [Ignavibacteria bacterium RBG_16_35_7]|nr:MAG: hypothetical protein A2W11_06140 [Ignavibacteria bacterium RBG_16_35_7]